LASEVWARLLTPLPDGLIGDHHSSLREKFLDISEAQGEAMKQPDGMTDDFRREAVSRVQTSIVFHPPSLRGTGSS
jgi:hypothetical protein